MEQDKAADLFNRIGLAFKGYPGLMTGEQRALRAEFMALLAREGYQESNEVAALRLMWHHVAGGELADQITYTHAQVGMLLDAIPMTGELGTLRIENADLREVAAFNARQAERRRLLEDAVRKYFSGQTTAANWRDPNHEERERLTVEGLREMRQAMAHMDGE